MTNFSDAMKALFYILAFMILALSQVFADVCDDAVTEFQMNTEELLNKRMFAIDHMREFSLHYSTFRSQIADAPCAAAAIDSTSDARLLIKEKRIETISKYLKLGIKEEGGKDISLEYDYLTGKSKKFKYDFEDVFSDSAGKTPEPIKKYEDIVVPVVKPSAPVNTKCTDVLLQNEAVNLENVRNQDSVGWCYAYVASDLLSYRLKKRISAVSLYSSGQDIEKDVRSKSDALGGDIREAIENYIEKKNGLCLEEDLPSNDFKFCTDKIYNDFLNDLINVAREKRIESELSSNQCFGKDLEAAFPGTNISLIKNHINRFGSRKLIEYLYDNQCKKISFKGIKVNPVAVTTSKYQKDFVMKTMDDLLSRGEPAAVGYDYKVLNGESGSSGHASLVVGRRLNPESGACEYLVRNSWGRDCEQNEGPGLSCHKNCTETGCRYSGHFWVSAQRLTSSILGVTYLP